MPFPKRPLELYTHTAEEMLNQEEWRQIVEDENCIYLGRRCIKSRKSQPELTIGTCTVGYQGKPIAICPARFLQNRQIFVDTIHLLEGHSPGNQLHIVPEIAIPGGNVDFFVVSVRRNQVVDYLALEIQTLDTTGTVWPARQEFIRARLGQAGFGVASGEETAKSYGMNWKMTAKTILVQMHHKVETLELLGKKLVLVIQDELFQYMGREFSTVSLRNAEVSDAAHFHVYGLNQTEAGVFMMEMTERHSTNTVGIESMLGLRQSADIPEAELLRKIQAKISPQTLLTI